MTRTFQINTLFPGLTVLESVVLAICERAGHAPASGTGPSRSQREAVDEAQRAARLAAARRASATTLTRNLAYGKQRLLEIALALATQPAILLLDEPAAGIPAGESAELFGVIAHAAARRDDRCSSSTTWISCSASPSASPCWSRGKVLTEGTPAEIAADPRVREVYLGEAQHG